jgi:hypothetical protein
MLKDEIGNKKPFKKKQVNLSQPTKISMQVIHAIEFNKFFYSID